MPSRTNIRGTQVKDESIQRQDLDVSNSGKAVITKIIAGDGIALSSTGVDEGTGDVSISVSSVPSPVGIQFLIDGAGDVITIGSKGYLEIPFDMTITGWTISSDQPGSIVVDVKKSDYSDFPTTSSITGSDKPTLSSSRKNQNLSLSGWTTTVMSGDIFEFNVDSIDLIKKVTLSIRGTKS